MAHGVGPLPLPTLGCIDQRLIGPRSCLSSGTWKGLTNHTPCRARPSPHCACSLCGPAFEFPARASSPRPPPLAPTVRGHVRGLLAAEARCGGAGPVAPGDGSAGACGCAGVSEVGGGVGADLAARTGSARAAPAASSAPGGPSGFVRTAEWRPECLWPGRSRCAALSRGCSRFPPPRGVGRFSPRVGRVPPSGFSASVPGFNFP